MNKSILIITHILIFKLGFRKQSTFNQEITGFKSGYEYLIGYVTVINFITDLITGFK
jgi:hypothetical protein